jgi:hypothetical protein
MKQQFILQPFEPFDRYLSLELTGSIERQNNILSLNYLLSGDLSKIVIPPPAILPTRQDELWLNTCFEFFLAIPETPNYWEFNLSPAGHWNVYSFTDYRQGMNWEKAVTELPDRVNIQDNCFKLSLSYNLNSIIEENIALEVGITAVIKTINNISTYWALNHPAPQADFHQRESFLIDI